MQRFFSEDSKMTQANEDNRRYKILQLVTTGWELADPDRAVNLTRDQCDATLDSLVNLEGINPTKLKVVLNETPLPE